MLCSFKPQPGTAVVVTGCDCGIGALTTAKLAEDGYTVFAGCLTEAGCKTVVEATKEAARARVRPLMLDVTSEASIQAFVAAVKAETPSLYAVVNNAGIGAFGMVDWLGMSAYRSVFEVNFFGMVAVTKAFLPMLMALDPTSRRRGRVVNMSSAAGTVAAPGWSPYAASKYAVEGWSDSLRREVAPYGMHVSLIEPSFLKTPMVEDITARYGAKTWAACDEETKSRWGEAFYQDWATKMAIPPAKEAEPPQLAVTSIVKALKASKPKLRYRPNWRSKTFYYYLTLLPGGCVDAMVASDPVLAPAAPPAWALREPGSTAVTTTSAAGKP